MLNWAIVALQSANELAFGSVKKIGDLYDARIWGPTRDLSCECGKYQGNQHAGIICDQCWVKVVSDSASARRSRLGKIELGVPIRHPLDPRCIIENFPVVPIAFRIGSDGTPNPLGQKYEQLVSIRDDVVSKLPPRDSEEYYPQLAERRVDLAPLRNCLLSIVGVAEVDGKIAHTAPDSHTLFHELLQAMLGLDGHIDSIVRSMGCELMAKWYPLSQKFDSSE